MRRLAQLSIVVILLSPFLIWILRLPSLQGLSHIDGRELIWPLKYTLTQTALSAIGALALGFLMALGLLSIRHRASSSFLEFWLLIPNLLPQLILILAYLNWSRWMPGLSHGLFAVITLHVLLNAGLVALAFVRFVETRLTGFVSLALIEGASKTTIWFRVILPYLKSEILFLGLFVFSVCLTSFAIPLVLGGVRASNLEMAIYNSIRMDGDWSKALVFAFLQMFILFAFAWAIPKPNWSLEKPWGELSLLSSKWFLVFAVAPSALILGGWITGLAMETGVWRQFLNPDLIVITLNTLIVSLGVGLLTLLLTLQVSYGWPHRGVSLFLRGYMTPSAAITGFAMLLLPGSGETAVFLKMIFALTLLNFPLLFRWIGQSSLASMEDQILVARSLGGSWWSIIDEIIWPQKSGAFLRMAGLSALWASGEFAVCSLLSGSLRTWALFVNDLMGAYRLNLASIMTIPLCLIGICCYFFFMGANRYVSR